MFSTKKKSKNENPCVSVCFTENVTYDGLGKVVQRLETWNSEQCRFSYRYDGEGHLTAVCKNGKLTEQYKYNARGQRIAMGLHKKYSYTQTGLLSRAGNVFMTYTDAGQLFQLKRLDASDEKRYKYNEIPSWDIRFHRFLTTTWHYEGEKLTRVLLPNGKNIECLCQGRLPHANSYVLWR